MSLRGKVGKVIAGAGVGAHIGGPIGALFGAVTPAAYSGGKAAIRGSRTLAAKTTAMHAGSRFAENRALGMIARHPVATGVGAYSVASAYHRVPGSNVSRRNQNDPYLRRIRNHQQSTAISGLLGHSSGSFA